MYLLLFHLTAIHFYGSITMYLSLFRLTTIPFIWQYCYLQYYIAHALMITYKIYILLCVIYITFLYNIYINVNVCTLLKKKKKKKRNFSLEHPALQG